MLASAEFNKIIRQIQSSNLNYQLQISPFSAYISVRKTFAKDRSGNLLLPKTISSVPSVSMDNFDAKNSQLENDLTSLRFKYEEAVDDCAKAYQNIKTLEDQLKLKNEESVLLRTKLEKAEKEISKTYSDNKDRTVKLSNEIAMLKLCVKEESENVLKHKSDANKANRDLKSMEKNIHDLEKKNKNIAKKNLVSASCKE